MKARVIVGSLCVLIGGASLAQTLLQLYRMRSQGIGAVSGGGDVYLLLMLGIVLLVIALILRLRARN